MSEREEVVVLECPCIDCPFEGKRPPREGATTHKCLDCPCAFTWEVEADD